MGSRGERQTLDEIRREIDAEYGAEVSDAPVRLHDGDRHRAWRRRVRRRSGRMIATSSIVVGGLAVATVLGVLAALLAVTPSASGVGRLTGGARPEAAPPAAWAESLRDESQGRSDVRLVEAAVPSVVLRTLLEEWIDATNTRDLERQAAFYAPTVAAYYRAREIPREQVLADKARQFKDATVLAVEAGEPDIAVDAEGRAAIMYFRKRFLISGERLNRRGEVEQELRWAASESGWRIVSERDVRVIR